MLFDRDCRAPDVRDHLLQRHHSDFFVFYSVCNIGARNSTFRSRLSFVLDCMSKFLTGKLWVLYFALSLPSLFFRSWLPSAYNKADLPEPPELPKPCS